MLVWRELHPLLLMLTNCWYSLTSQTVSVLQCWSLPVYATSKGKGLACETNVSKFQINHKLARLSALETMSETVQKMLKQSKKMSLSVFRANKTRTAFHLLLCKLFEDFRHGCELFHEVQAPQTVADLYQQKDHPSIRDRYVETEQKRWITTCKYWIEKSTWGSG